MKAKKLIELMKKDKDLNLKEILEIRTYIPVSEKRTIIEDIVNKIAVVENGCLHCDTINKTKYFDIAMVKYHTNLDISYIDEDYDAIKECLLDRTNLHNILMTYYKDDYYECFWMLNTYLDDLKNDYSSAASFIKMLDTLTNRITAFSKKADDFNIKGILSNDTIEELGKLLEKYEK